MAKEYIEREALLERMETRLKQLRAENGDYDHYTDGFEEGLVAVDDAPAADVVEVRHGEWIFEHDPFRDPKRYFVRIVCSCCGLKTGEKSNFCPKCGAKMDGERKTE